MSRFTKTIVCVGIVGGLLFSNLLVSHAKNVTTQDVSKMPQVTLQVWKESSEKERMSFLYGFFAMLDLEMIWQQSKPVPLSKSLITAWSKGLSDNTVQEVYKGLTDYAANNPQESQKNVVEVMWFLFVQPVLTPQMQKEVAKATPPALLR